jgi:hypothetical protein
MRIEAIATYAWRDLGWQRMSLTSWKNEDGVLVKYLDRAEQLHGTRAILVYLAPGFDQRDNWWKLDEMMQQRDCERIYLDE